VAHKKTSPAEDLMDLVAMLPWWSGVALAFVSYVILHQLAATPKIGAVQPNQIADAVGRSMVAGLAAVGQFVLPLICLLGALLSFLRRRKRESLVGVITQAKCADSLNGMSWREFEILVGEAFRLQGYKVTEHGGAGPDGGVDLVLRKGTETHLVQCKQWKAYQVGPGVVRELYGVMAANGAAGGFVVTSGSFTPDAKAFADGRNVKLVDGPKLFGLIQQAKTSLLVGATAATPANAAVTERSTGESSPFCPLCKSSMVRRTAKKGTNAGSQFWGCSQFPACRGTR
jgi:restriction system protein